MYSQGLNLQLSSFGSDNGLALMRWQAIIWNKDVPVYWCIYASLSLNESMGLHKIFMPVEQINTSAWHVLLLDRHEVGMYFTVSLFQVVCVKT